MNTEGGIEFLESIKPGKVQAYRSIEDLNTRYLENLNETIELLRKGEGHRKVLVAVKRRFSYLTQMGRTVRYTHEEIVGIINDMEQTFFPKTKPPDKVVELLKELDKDVHELLEICEERMGD